MTWILDYRQVSKNKSTSRHIAGKLSSMSYKENLKSFSTKELKNDRGCQQQQMLESMPVVSSKHGVRDPIILFSTKVNSTDSKMKKNFKHILAKFTTHTNMLKELKDMFLKEEKNLKGKVSLELVLKI